MNETVTPDWPVPIAFPEYRDMAAVAGRTYEAWTNSHGAVCAVLEDGRKLGVKPLEFEVVEWHEVNTCSLCRLPTGGKPICDACARDASEEIKAMRLADRDCDSARDGLASHADRSLFLAGDSGVTTTSGQGTAR